MTTAQYLSQFKPMAVKQASPEEFYKAMQEREERISEYRLMYYTGVWVTAERIYAEDDAEAIHDARESYETAAGNSRLEYALWHGNTKVATFKDMLSDPFVTVK